MNSDLVEAPAPGTLPAVAPSAGPATEPRESGVEVYRKLREAIVSGRLQPNERLVEIDLARLLGAGRTSIRAALVRLDQEGLVTRLPHRGARVRLISDREAIEIEQVRIALERLIARRAGETVNDADLGDLRRILVDMRKRVEGSDPIGYSELNGQFHQRIWAIADNQLAIRLLTTLKSQSSRFQYRTILRPGRTQESLNEHEALLAALVKRDPDACEAAMAEHLANVVETLKWAIDSHRSQPPWLPR